MRDTEQQCPSFSNKENKIFVGQIFNFYFWRLNLSFKNHVPKEGRGKPHNRFSVLCSGFLFIFLFIALLWKVNVND